MKYIITAILLILHFSVCALSGSLGWDKQILVVSLMTALIIGLAFRKYKLPLLLTVFTILPFFLVYSISSIAVGSVQTYTIWIWGILGSLLFIYLFGAGKKMSTSILFVIIFSLTGYYFIWPNHFAYLNTETSPGGYKPLHSPIVDINNNPVDVAQFKGKVVLIDVWHSACGLCITQFPRVEELSNYYKSDSMVKIISLNYPLGKDSVDKPLRFIKNYSFAKLFYRGQDSISSHVSEFVPKTLILDKNGKCRYAGALNTDWNIRINNAYSFIETLKNETY